MPDTGSSESPQSPLPPSSPDDARNEENDSAPQLSSLRPTSRAQRFSMRRLLNVASVLVAAIALLALAIHWLPDVLPKPPNMRKIHEQQTFDAAFPPAPGTGWKSIGPDWAKDITFTSNGTLGYACGVVPPNPIVFFAVYDTHQQTWMQSLTPATGGSSCEVYVSPTAGRYVVISVDYCHTANNCSASRLYDSFDGGETWSELHLPGTMIVYSAAWTSSKLFLAARGYLATNSTSIPFDAPSHLLVSQWDASFILTRPGSFAEVDARQLIGQPMQFSNISLISSDTTLYASVTRMSCSSYCTIQVRSTDGGAHWTPFAATYRGNPIALPTAQLYTHRLIGWAFLPQSSATLALQSFDDGDSWQELPQFPTNPTTGGVAMFALPDDSLYAFCFGKANRVYVLPAGASQWRPVAPIPNGYPLTVQIDAVGHAVALWGRGIRLTASGKEYYLEYYPLT